MRGGGAFCGVFRVCLIAFVFGFKAEFECWGLFVLDFERVNYGIFFHARKLLKDRQSCLQMKLKF